MKELIIYLLARHRGNFIVRSIAGLCLSFLKGVENYSYNWKLNGEAFVLEKIQGFGPKVIFDVGANRGDWAVIATEKFPDAKVHCFEIAPPTIVHLKKRLVGNSNCVINELVFLM